MTFGIPKQTSKEIVASKGNAERKEMVKMSSPKKRFTCGCVEGLVWENERAVGDRRFTVASVTFSRRYKKSNGDWDSSNSFGRNDLPKLAIVCDEAYRYLSKKGPDEETEATSANGEN